MTSCADPCSVTGALVAVILIIIFKYQTGLVHAKDAADRSIFGPHTSCFTYLYVSMVTTA